jgi:hypothetical protein
VEPFSAPAVQLRDHALHFHRQGLARVRLLQHVRGALEMRACTGGVAVGEAYACGFDIRFGRERDRAQVFIDGTLRVIVAPR